MRSVLDLNDLRVFERVASLRSFSAAARELGLPKSTVSRSVARLEAALGAPLFRRTTREVALTSAGEGLERRCADILGRVEEAVDYVGSVAGEPRGTLSVATGIGFGVRMLAELLPEFLLRYPSVRVSLDLTTKPVEFLAGGVDVLIRMGPLEDSSLVAVRLGSISRHLCASPAYLARRGAPASVEELGAHDAVEMPSFDGRPRAWRLSRGGETAEVEVRARVVVNDALTIHRLVLNGAGIGVVSGYLCAPDVAAGRLVKVLPEWTSPPVEVSALFPSRRELSPTVRAFVDFMKEANVPGRLWQDDPLKTGA